MDNKILNGILADIKKLLKIQDKKRFLKQNIPYLVFFYLGNIFAKHVNSYVGGDIIDKIFAALGDLKTLSFIPSLKLKNILAGIVFTAIIKLIVYEKGKNRKKFRQGKEYGSARWVA